MLVVRVAQDVVGDTAGQRQDKTSSFVLSTRECAGAADTRGAFVTCGTVIERINGSARLIRLDDVDLKGEEKEVDDNVDRVTWGGRRNSREWRRDRKESSTHVPEAKPTPIVFLPAVPSYLPLWGLLSPEDALRCVGAHSGEPSPVTAAAERNSPAPSPTDASKSTVTLANHGRGNGGSGYSPSARTSPTLADPLRDSSVGEIDRRDTGSDDRVGKTGHDHDGDMDWKGNKKSGRGAVRLLQVVTAERTPYRYAVLLHFWDTADAASFVSRFTGLSLPGLGVLKPLFLSGAQVVTNGALKADGGNDARTAALRRHRRRSLSEGVNLAAEAGRDSAKERGGIEEFKSNWPHAASPDRLLRSSPPHDRLRKTREQKNDQPTSPPPQTFPPRTTVKDNVETDSRTDPRTSDDRDNWARSGTGSGVGTGSIGGGVGDGDGARERKGGEVGKEDLDSAIGRSVSPPALQWQAQTLSLPLNGPSTGPGIRRLRLWTKESDPSETAGASGIDNAEGRRDGDQSGGGDGGMEGGGAGIGGRVGGDERRGTELPPCPVCLDRLDPFVSGVPSARRRVGGSAVDHGFDTGGGRCCHRSCVVAGVAEGRLGSNGALIGGGGEEGETGSEEKRSQEDSAAGVASYAGARALNVRGGGGGGGDVESFWETTVGPVGESAQIGRGLKRSDGAVTRGMATKGKGGAGGEETGAAGTTVLNAVIWRGSTCRVCRCLSLLEGAPELLYCETCHIAHNLWICMVCGHIGCGRYTEEHANRHFCLFRHTYSLELSTGRVWDYAGDCYAHRALRGHSAPINGGHDPREAGRYKQSWEGSPRGSWGAVGGMGSGRDALPPLYSERELSVRGEAGRSGEGFSGSLKVEVVSREYEALLGRQLQEQQRYFEGIIAKAISADAEANAPAEEVLTEEEREEVERLRREVGGFSQRYEGILESLRADEEAARKVRAENRMLVAQQKGQKEAVCRLKKEALETKRLCQGQMAELDGQMQDLMFFLKAQQEVKASPRRDELLAGSVVMGASTGTSTVGGAGEGNRGGGKESERERLARRLKERSNARRAGGMA